MHIRFTAHAEDKFAALTRHGIRITKDQVITTVQKPKQVDHSRAPLRIAQSEYDKTRVLRVVYRIENHSLIIITFYPGRKTQYEKE